MAARGAAPDLDFCADPDRLLRVVPALPSAWHDGLQFLPFLVAHHNDWAVAVGTELVSMGAARVRYNRCSDLVARAEIPCGLWPVDFCLAQPADDGFCRPPGRLHRVLSAHASGVWRRKLVRARPLPVSHTDQPHPALPRLFLYRRRYRRQPEIGYPCGKRRDRQTLSSLACLGGTVLWHHPAPGLCPSQLDREFCFPGPVVENSLR